MRSFIVLSLFLLVGLAVPRPGFALDIEKMYCEMLENPLGIEADMPRLSWIAVDPDKNRGNGQSAYHIQVASSRDQLKNDQADIWDSGKVECEVFS